LTRIRNSSAPLPPSDDRLHRTSKFLSYVLRHDPGALGLTPDPGGWVDVETLVERARAWGRSMSRPRIRHVMAAGDKTRFARSDDGEKIRAPYGHSIDVDLGRIPTPPPDELYHGAHSALSSIREEGLRPQARQYVHLSATPETADAVGRRHGRAVGLRVEPAPSTRPATHSTAPDAVWLPPPRPAFYVQCPDG